MAEQKPIGEVTHFFGHLGVAVFKLSAPLKVGDKIQVKGHTTDFEQEVKEMQVEHEAVTEAKKGSELGIKVDEVVRTGDKVYLK
jgi:putative protease